MVSSVARWDDEAQPHRPLRTAHASDRDESAIAERIIEDEVRELVRRREMDPSGDAVAAVRSLIDDVVADYSERTLTVSMPVLVEPAAVAKAVADRVIGLGPLQRYFDDPDVEEIWINQPDKVFVAKAGRPILTGTVLSEEQVHDLVELMLRASGRRVDLSTPFVDASLADGSRLHVVIPDVTRRHWAVNVRKFVLRANRLDELVRLGTMTPQCARFLEAAVVAGVNLVAAGATQQLRAGGARQADHAAVVGRGEHLAPVHRPDSRGSHRSDRVPSLRPRRAPSGRGGARGAGSGRRWRDRVATAVLPGSGRVAVDGALPAARGALLGRRHRPR